MTSTVTPPPTGNQATGTVNDGNDVNNGGESTSSGSSSISSKGTNIEQSKATVARLANKANHVAKDSEILVSMIVEDVKKINLDEIPLKDRSILMSNHTLAEELHTLLGKATDVWGRVSRLSSAIGHLVKHPLWQPELNIRVPANEHDHQCTVLAKECYDAVQAMEVAAKQAKSLEERLDESTRLCKRRNYLAADKLLREPGFTIVDLRKTITKLRKPANSAANVAAALASAAARKVAICPEANPVLRKIAKFGNPAFWTALTITGIKAAIFENRMWSYKTEPFDERYQAEDLWLRRMRKDLYDIFKEDDDRLECHDLLLVTCTRLRQHSTKVMYRVWRCTAYKNGLPRLTKFTAVEYGQLLSVWRSRNGRGVGSQHDVLPYFLQTLFMALEEIDENPRSTLQKLGYCAFLKPVGAGDYRRGASHKSGMEQCQTMPYRVSRTRPISSHQTALTEISGMRGAFMLENKSIFGRSEMNRNDRTLYSNFESLQPSRQQDPLKRMVTRFYRWAVSRTDPAYLGWKRNGNERWKIWNESDEEGATSVKTGKTSVVSNDDE